MRYRRRNFLLLCVVVIICVSLSLVNEFSNGSFNLDSFEINNFPIRNNISVNDDKGSNFDFQQQGPCCHQSPIVIEQHKLIFFTTPKIGDTVFKQLMRRMMGYQDWNQTTNELPHNPQHNGLKYLSEYTSEEAARMLSNSSGWTKAIFVRDPKQRVLSSYLDFVVANDAKKFRDFCCWNKTAPCHVPKDFGRFVEASIRNCQNLHWVFLTPHLQEQYWQHVDFVGHLETAAEDTRTLLTQLGVWEQYGQSGWGRGGKNGGGDASIFEEPSSEWYRQKNKEKLEQHYTLKSELFVDLLFKRDFDNKHLDLKRTQVVDQAKYEDDDNDDDTLSSTNKVTVPKYKLARVFGVETIDYAHLGERSRDPEADKPVKNISRTDSIYRRGSWHESPVVVPKFKLVFFTIPKVACTAFKQLFRRIQGFEDWKIYGDSPTTHDPKKNGLRYLNEIPEDKAVEMMTSDEWTRAIFVRDPKERILSAYLDKAMKWGYDSHIRKQCCFKLGQCQQRARDSLKGFLQVATHCRDYHWKPQAYRMEDQYWKYINFVGHIETARDDAKRLLQQVGAWKEYGSSGWGKSGNESMFASTGSVGHATQAADHMREYFDRESETMVHEIYRMDYEHPAFNFTVKSMFD